MQTIGLGVIVKPTEEEAALLDRLLGNVAEHVDAVHVTITGTCKAVERVARRHGAQVSYCAWEDDFSKARAANLAQVTEDWYLWLDTDDTLRNPERLRELVAEAPGKLVEGFALWYEYARDERGNVVDAHWKTQLLRNNGHFEWRGAIHEDPQQLRPATWAKSDAVVRVHGTTPERTAESYARNLRILRAELERNPQEPRTMFYLGRTYVASGELEKAVEMLGRYLELSGWDEERYEARILVGDCYLKAGDYSSALQAFNDAVLEREDYPDAHIYKGSCYLKLEDWEKAAVCFRTALSRRQPSGSTYFNPMLYARDVLVGLAVAELNRNRLEDAYRAVSGALRADPGSPEASGLRDIIVRAKNNADTVRKYADIAKFMAARGEEDKILPLLHVLPDDIADNPVLLGLRRERLPGEEWPERSIAIYCGPTAESWTPDSVNGGGIGGSETAVVELGKRLAARGWKVVVYSQCDAPAYEELEFDGVEYRNYWTFNPRDRFDVLWSWRLPELFDLDVDARLKVLDLHDVMHPSDLTPERVEKIDRIMVKSRYHCSLYPNVPDGKFRVVGNGIDLARFSVAGTEREPRRFIYSSTPNRGLDILLGGVWQKIREALPDAELHVYYGWETFMRLERHNPERMRWARKMAQLIEETPGVVSHGRVGQAELAGEQLRSSYWLYPTYFPEIHCITACEMQAAGVVPVTSGFAALEETQQSGVKFEGDVHDPAWQAEYARKVIELAKDPEATRAMREQAVQAAQAFSWEEVADAWDRELCA